MVGALRATGVIMTTTRIFVVRAEENLQMLLLVYVTLTSSEFT